MSQVKKEAKSHSNSDDIARPIIQTIVDQAASKKPPLPHHPPKSNGLQKGNGNEAETEQKTTILTDANALPSAPDPFSKQKSSTNRNIVFHPDHPEKLYDDELSTSTTHSQSPQPKAQQKQLETNSTSIATKQQLKQQQQQHIESDANSKTTKTTTNGAGSPSQQLTRDQRRERRERLEDPNCFPKRFEVQVQARVRVGEDLSSQHLTDLPEGSVVTVEEIKDRRARISRPLCGWLSVTSKFGARIILPTNSKYSKIGGKVVFKRPIQGQPLLANNTYPTQAKVVDYNDDTNQYKVRYNDGSNTTQWIDIEDANIHFKSQHAPVRVQKPLDGTAPTFTLQTSQAFFNQFFCKDYPQYQAQSSSTTRHMDISPIAVQQNQGNRGGPYGAYPPMQGMQPPHNGMYPPPQRYPPNDPRSRYPPQQQPRYPPNDPRNVHPSQRGYPHPQQHGVPPRGHPQHPYAAQPQHPYPPQAPSNQKPKMPTKPTAENGVVGSPSKSKGGNEEFVNKVKEIERRIIQHLHQRGYDESHPDYHRYLQKAKELAIQKAGKEREKMIAQHRQRNPSNPLDPMQQGRNPRISQEEYAQYMKYRKEKERQHLLAEQLRKQKLAEQQAAAATKEKLTSPQNKSGSVKGLIVLRGLPGSGKTTLAKKLAQRSKNARICTEDRYHWSGKEDGVGEYKFQPQLVFLAREWCTKEIRECIQSNVNLIILDNHNARISMYEDHIQYAVEHGYRFRIIEFVATASLIDKYRNRSYKKFPREVYVKLLKLWEHDPRTELINPTFGPTAAAPTTTTKEEVKKDENDVNGGDDDKDDGGGGGDKKKEQEEKPQNGANYGTSPLEQGLNLKKDNNDK